MGGTTKVGTALAYQPNLPKQWQVSEGADANIPRIEWKNTKQVI